MVELANRHPSEYDAHTHNASVIFGKPESEITKDERYLGKKVVHGSQRGLRGEKMSDNISKDTKGAVFVHPKRCDALIERYHEEAWEIRKIYFPWVERQIRDVGVLVNSWGRRLDFRVQSNPLEIRRIDDDMYREGYSYYMQSECADWTNQYGFIPISQYMQGMYGKPVSAQTHDEIMVSVPLRDAWMTAKYMVTALEQTREIPRGSGNYLTIWAEVIVGRSWGDKRFEWKRLPSYDEFYAQLEKGGFNA